MTWHDAMATAAAAHQDPTLSSRSNQFQPSVIHTHTLPSVSLHSALLLVSSSGQQQALHIESPTLMSQYVMLNQPVPVMHSYLSSSMGSRCTDSASHPRSQAYAG
jgi:hypothetical protein